MFEKDVEVIVDSITALQAAVLYSIGPACAFFFPLDVRFRLTEWWSSREGTVTDCRS